ncbi:MAG: hypothetical protein FD173_2173 [Gallionellaceae bacterium]|nr:MAG: hypothetical protein FD173_2173 [Gallionellaceae bacterium]
MDVSSEMIHSLLPLFMVTVLGASALTVGLMLLWDRFGASFTFYAGAAFCGVTLVGLLVRAGRLHPK